MYHLHFSWLFVVCIICGYLSVVCIPRIYTAYLYPAWGSYIWQYYWYTLCILIIMRVHHTMVSWLYMKYRYICPLCILAMSIHLLAFTLHFSLFLLFCQEHMLYGVLLFWRALNRFWHAASCAGVKSALTQSSYLPVFSDLWRVACAVYAVYTAGFSAATRI